MADSVARDLPDGPLLCCQFRSTDVVELPRMPPEQTTRGTRTLRESAIAAPIFVAPHLCVGVPPARWAGSRGSNRRTGRVSMALIVKARRPIRQPVSVNSYSSS